MPNTGRLAPAGWPLRLVPDEGPMSPRFSQLQIQFRNRWKDISEHQHGDPVTGRCGPVITKPRPALSPEPAPGCRSFTVRSQPSACGPGGVPPPWPGSSVSAVPKSADLPRSDFPSPQTGFDPARLSLRLSPSVSPSVPPCLSVNLCSCQRPSPHLPVTSCLSTNTASFFSGCSVYLIQTQPDYSSS